MNSRHRFLETMRYGSPDRVPYFEEGIREEVLAAWHAQGLAPDRSIDDRFPTDRREEILLDLDPHPEIKKWPASRKELEKLRDHFNPEDPGRFPGDWPQRVRAWQNRDHLLMLRVHRGFFQTMGVGGWERFHEVMMLLSEDIDRVRAVLRIRGEFAARMAERVLQAVDIDAAIFSEPIGGNDRPLISPKMYEETVLPGYRPLLNVLRDHGVKTVVFRTYANARLLLPRILSWGFNCLWACEVNVAAMDYRDIRRELGTGLRLIGGIDLDALRRGKRAIRREIEEKVPPLLAQGGYVPVADGRIRQDVSFENYVFYRKVLDEVIGGQQFSANTCDEAG